MERFEKNKLKNFVSSSRLEGIDIPIFDEKASLEKILAKHGRPLNG
ncbi:MAG: YhfG family protein [Pseudomonas sp.]|uniref:YhfG family protein n=1 Tax=Pseudomonas idahonensis TaxID=2942628 RepID=A0ABT5PYB4_9PSED|nr:MULTISPECIES: YhfG family protein [Pseudomonas]MBW8353753.1 YhfG family protein [Pseudomonas sp.]MDD1146913.1 YhfG family protein [Pseudomonas idahonensis]UZE37789.1 YhfG family protein [Pseudomonas sp. B21-059]